MLHIPILLDAGVHNALGTHLLDIIDLWVRWIAKPVYSHIYSIDSWYACKLSCMNLETATCLHTVYD